MDLSAIIFVVLALAWAVYLIPKALKHHDEMASDRLVQGHSDKVRILSRKTRAAVTEAVEAITPDEPEMAVETPEPLGRARSKPTRASAGTAAQRRRRVLGVLVLALVVVWTLTWFAYLPIWAPGVPGALVVAWLVLARLSVRRQQRSRRVTRVESTETSLVEQEHRAPHETAPAAAAHTGELVDRLADEDTSGLARAQIEAVLADDGSLWDPLPMTLPTYVNKARARRTVRTIELTGINSSGHDETDSALAREAAESTPSAEQSEAQRKVAGA